jgi:hypothetical protein
MNEAVKILVGSKNSGQTSNGSFASEVRSPVQAAEGPQETKISVSYRLRSKSLATFDTLGYADDHVSGVFDRADDQLDASYLVKLGSDDTDLGLLARCSDKVASRLLDCSAQLKSGRGLEADDTFMSAKEVVAEIFMLRTISEAVGLVSMSALKAFSTNEAVVDTPELPDVIRKAVTRLAAAPFMDFGAACMLSDEIEVASKCSSLPGYNELASELIADAAVSDE